MEFTMKKIPILLAVILGTTTFALTTSTAAFANMPRHPIGKNTTKPPPNTKGSLKKTDADLTTKGTFAP